MQKQLDVVLSFLNQVPSTIGVTSSGKELFLNGKVFAKWRGKEVVICGACKDNKSNGLRNLLLSLAAGKGTNCVSKVETNE